MLLISELTNSVFIDIAFGASHQASFDRVDFLQAVGS